MEYLGDRTRAAHRLVDARLERDQVARAFDQLVENLRALTAAHIVHADLSVYNLLWWQGRVWIIDVPQAVEISAHAQAFDFLHRDLRNVAGWFRSQGVPFDADAVLIDLVSSAFG